ncbi:MAG: replication-associated recombination protein A, partial [Actinomycetota bacterium]
AAAHALDHVGLPEAQLNLAQAVVYLATAPKSNSVAMGIWGAREDIRRGVAVEVPAKFRDAHYSGSQTLGYGTEYQYPHDDPRGWVDEDYLPNQEGATVIRQDSYYRPSPHGWETEVARRMSKHGTSEESLDE